MYEKIEVLNMLLWLKRRVDAAEGNDSLNAVAITKIINNIKKILQ